MISPSRIRLARLRRGLSLTKLAAATGLSVRSLSGYENGELNPSDAALRTMAETLGVRVGFFSQDEVEIVEAASVSFRKLSKTTASQRDAALAGATMTLGLSDWLDEHYVLPSPNIPSHDGTDPETAAELVRAAWTLADRPVSNLLHLLEAHGVRVFTITVDTSDIDAFSFWRDGTPFIFVSTSKSAERQRFDLAHELGHLVLHGDFETSPQGREREIEANTFASAFLMPADGILTQNMRSAPISRILRCRSYWKVSAMALAHRLHAMKLLSDWQYRSVCIELAKAGYRSNEPGSSLIPESSQVLRKVFFDKAGSSVASELVRHLDLPRDELRSHIDGLVPFAVA